MGGEDNAGNVLKETRIFDLSTSTWNNGADMPVTLTGHAAVAMGTEIYVFGGRVAPSQLSNKLYIYNTSKYRDNSTVTRDTEPIDSK
jgi:N-acetylneuraminic acid mutarotase